MESVPRTYRSSKIPGVMPLMKSEKQIKDITALTQLQLLEIKEREEKLLSNKANLKRLPDKGKRIQEFYDKIVHELNRRSNIEEAARLMSEMNIVSKGEKVINGMEWNHGKYTESSDPVDDVLDSDDEAEMNPLRIIAQRQMHERRVRILKPEPSLITPEDLEEIKTFSANSSDSGLCTDSNTQLSSSDASEEVASIDADLITVDVSAKLPSLKTKLKTLVESSSHGHAGGSGDLDKHVLYVVDKSENHAPQREKFKPYKATKTNVHDPEKERARKQGHKWEVTAATPPPIQHVGTQALSLLDSIEIQNNYLKKLKELREKQAEERLIVKSDRLANIRIRVPGHEEAKTNQAFTAYRAPTNHIEGDQQYNEDDELHDPLDNDKCAGVNYTVFF